MSQDDPAGFPEFVPGVEAIVTALQDQPLPAQTQAMLMRHYEVTGQFAKAEDALYSILDAVGPDQEVIRFPSLLLICLLCLSSLRPKGP